MGSCVARAILLGWAAGLLAGCATLDRVDWTGERMALEDAQRRYTHLVRWGEFERASEHVPPEDRAHYLSDMAAYGELRFTDYETMLPEVDTERGEALVEVVYHGYSPRTLEERTYRETQHWRLGEGGWLLEARRPPLMPARSVGAY